MRESVNSHPPMRFESTSCATEQNASELLLRRKLRNYKVLRAGGSEAHSLGATNEFTAGQTLGKYVSAITWWFIIE
eukprot:scaffold160309_cov57-Attheya_sp.AAC.2